MLNGRNQMRLMHQMMPNKRMIPMDREIQNFQVRFFAMIQLFIEMKQL